MGVDILTFANHQIKGISLKKRLDNIELKLNKKIKITPYSYFTKVSEMPKTNSITDTTYYCFCSDNAEDDYRVTGEILLATNNRYLKTIRIFKKTLNLNPNFTTDYYYWKSLLGGKNVKDMISLTNLEYKDLWNSFQKIKFDLIKKLGGDKLVYINDQSFQGPEDLFYRGMGIEKIIPELEKIGPLFEIDKLYNNYNEIDDDLSLSYYGFYEEILKDTK
jgi:hypothetical protein